MQPATDGYWQSADEQCIWGSCPAWAGQTRIGDLAPWRLCPRHLTAWSVPGRLALPPAGPTLSTSSTIKIEGLPEGTSEVDLYRLCSPYGAPQASPSLQCRCPRDACPPQAVEPPPRRVGLMVEMGTPRAIFRIKTQSVPQLKHGSILSSGRAACLCPQKKGQPLLQNLGLSLAWPLWRSFSEATLAQAEGHQRQNSPGRSYVRSDFGRVLTPLRHLPVTRSHPRCSGCMFNKANIFCSNNFWKPLF